MPGQRGSENRQPNRMFTMRLDDAEWVRLEEIAHHSGVSRADVIRRMLAHDHTIEAALGLQSDFSNKGRPKADKMGQPRA
ncbi:hypothetical protein GCM10022253_30820 [Sphingomonas endophytica]|uniref:Transcriptional regulator n=1 Tax=Sphingomonas endophytica TaxID=869719 RepID=A0ABR6N6Y7_9SPHN|nr:CopG family transcriptional regulator [Sphingomonas endophytica]MBB5726553.1 putative transcriptional regulator [Sphingomonas endophytica]